MTWRSLVNGAVTKTFTSPRQIFGEIVAEDHNVYVPTSLFDEFGGSSDMGVTAVSLTTGTEQWNATTDYPVRAGMAVGDSVLWVTPATWAASASPASWSPSTRPTARCFAGTRSPTPPSRHPSSPTDA